MIAETTHVPVLTHEVLDALNIHKTDTVVDCTVGGGGHARAMVRLLGPKGVFVGIDADADALQRAQDIVASPATVHLVCDNFRNIGDILERVHVGTVDKALFDLGLSSDQLEYSGRGFTFRKNEPLLMTFSNDPMTHVYTAHDIVNEWDEENLATIITAYGEERFAKRIARAIVAQRANGALTTTDELTATIEQAIPARFRRGKIHPATKTMQAIRIAVNDEFGAVREALEAVVDKLSYGGRIAVVSFHSLEDRAVKQCFRDFVAKKIGVNMYKKPIVPTKEEVENNPRARSAKLRVFQKNTA